MRAPQAWIHADNVARTRVGSRGPSEGGPSEGGSASPSSFLVKQFKFY